jgi:hypothetical protein
MVQVCNHSDGGDNSVLIDDRSKRSGQGSIGVSFGDSTAKKLRRGYHPRAIFRPSQR